MDNIIKLIWSDKASSATQVYVLLDCARDERIHSELLLSKADHYCLYPGVLSEALARVAPYIVKLEPNENYTRWLIETGWGQNWGVYLVAGKSRFYKLMWHFRQFIRVQDERGKVFYFRFYDPRVLRAYLPTCTTQELRTFFGSVSHFYMEDRAGEHLLDFRFDGQSLSQRKQECSENPTLVEAEI